MSLLQFLSIYVFFAAVIFFTDHLLLECLYSIFALSDFHLISVQVKPINTTGLIFHFSVHMDTVCLTLNTNEITINVGLIPESSWG